MIDLPIRHILFPYDFSTQGQLAAPYVRAFAQRFGARVTILSVVPPAFASVPVALGRAGLHSGEQSAEWRHALQRQLDGAFAHDFCGIEVDRVTDSGDAALRVAYFAHNGDVDLVMMPT